MSSTKPTVLRNRDGLLILDKPAGWLVHPAGEGERPDLQTWLSRQRSLPRGQRPVHRLDSETSGLAMFSADPEVRGDIGRALAKGQVNKTYLALVVGRTRRKGVISRGLKDARRGKTVTAVTRYRSLEQLGGFTLVELHPESGRKHQLRRHMQGIGHAIVGDTRYRGKRFVKVPGFPGRLWLHALRLELPGGLEIEAPLPPELQAHLELLRRGLAEKEEAAQQEGEE